MILPEQLSAFVFINDIKEDPDGYIWLSSYKGLSCYDGHQLIHYNSKDSRDSVFLSEEGSGYMYLHTDDHGLHFWTLERRTENIVCFNTHTRKVVKYIEIEKGFYQAFYGGDNGLGIFTLQKPAEDAPWKIFSINKSNLDTLTVDIKEDVFTYEIVDGKHHVRTLADNYYIIDTLGNVDSISHKTMLDRITKLTVIDDEYYICKIFGNEVWLNDYHHGMQLWLQDEQRIEDYTKTINDLAIMKAPNSLRGNLSKVLQARDSSNYLLSENSLFHLKDKMPKEEEFFEPIYSGKPITSMRQIAEDDKGNIYASFYTGVASKKAGSNNFIDFRNTRTTTHDSETTYSLSYHKDKLIWNTTSYDLRNNTQEAVGIDDIGVHVNHVLEQDTLWVLIWYSNTWIKYVIPTEKDSIIKDDLFGYFSLVSALKLDGEGNFWLTTDKKGLLAMDRHGKLLKEITSEQLGLSLKDKALFDIHIEEDQAYIGTQVGLCILDLKTFESEIHNIPYAGNNGKRLERRIYSILSNDLGQFYLGTDHGLIFFDPDFLTFRELEKGHPLANKEFNRNSAYKASDGRYYIGTVDGLYSFLPDELVYEVDQADISKPTIYHLQVYNEKSNSQKQIISDWPEREKVKLKASDKNLLLEYSSPGLNTIWYSHRVQGLQEQWSAHSTEGKIDIYALPPGDFIIELKALKSPLDNTEVVTQLQIHKPQHWYLRWWVVGLYILALISLVAWLVRNRFQRKLNQQKELELLRTKISSDLHDDVGSLLGGLAIQSDLMSNVVPETYKSKLEEMSTTSRDAMDLMRDIVWALDSRKDKYENLIDRMRVFAESTLSRKKIAYAFEVHNIQGGASILPEVRQNVYLIFKEAITNIAKHSNGDHVQILFRKNGNKYELVIQDNGKPNSNQIKTDGQGMSNMKMRAKQISGSISFTEEAGFSVNLLF